MAGCRSGIRLLDAGCGFGGTVAFLNERLESMQMIGLNIDERQLQRAQATIHPAANNRIDWITADAAKLPLERDSIDIVLAVECIFHFRRSLFLAEVARVLQPGGVLAISDFVPTESMATVLSSSPFFENEAVRWSYGNVDMRCSLDKYRSLAASIGMQLTEADDITSGTLPTYDFLLEQSSAWQNREHAALFEQATRLLQKASQKGMIRYMILRFDKSPA